MEFQTGKCQFLKVTNKKQPIPTHYTIHDTPFLKLILLSTLELSYILISIGDTNIQA